MEGLDLGPLPGDQEAARARSSALTAERRLLGLGLCYGGDVAAEVTEAVDANHFGLPLHQALYGAMVALQTRGEHVNPVSAAAELEGRKGQPSEALVGQLVAMADPAGPYSLSHAHLAELVKAVRGFAALRRVAKAAAEILAAARSAQADEAAMLLEDFIDNLSAIESPTAAAGVDFRTLAAAAGDVLGEVKAAGAQPGRPPEDPGLPTGLTTLDREMRWRPGQIYLLAGKSGGGKTTLATWSALQVARLTGRVCLVFSIEMPSRLLAVRALAAESGVPMRLIESADLSGDQTDKLLQAHRRMSATETGAVWVFHKPRMGIDVVRQIVRKLTRARAPLGLVVVDYLQRFRPEVRSHSREQDVTAMGEETLAVAQTFKVPVLNVMQINRDGELRESDGPFHDAAGVLFINRSAEDRARLGVGKNRFGRDRDAGGKPLAVEVGYDPGVGSFWDIVDEHGWPVRSGGQR